MIFARVVLVLVAAVAIGVLVRQLTVVHDVEDAVTLARSGGAQGPSDPSVAEGRRLLHRAAGRTSDIQPLEREVELLTFAGRRAEAIPVAVHATREEPDNPRAWLLLAGTARGIDAALAARADAKVRELAPPPQD